MKTTVYIQNISDATIMNQVYVECKKDTSCFKYFMEMKICIEQVIKFCTVFPQNYPARATVQIAKLHLVCKSYKFSFYRSKFIYAFIHLADL